MAGRSEQLSAAGGCSSDCGSGDADEHRVIRQTSVQSSTHWVSMKKVAWICAVLAGVLIDITTCTETEEICVNEEFRSRCPRNHVVIMVHALYGRMSRGRCVGSDTLLGCQADVLHILDSECSGRRSCKIKVPNEQLDQASTTCPGEVRTYLSVSYNCLPVDREACETCSQSKVAKLVAYTGYISSDVSDELPLQPASCGSRDCPWLVTVNPGQTIRVTMFDFTYELGTEDDDDEPPMSTTDVCNLFAVVRETWDPVTAPVCGGRGRLREIYKSTTNELEITVIRLDEIGRHGNFIIRYEAVGCPDFKLPRHAEVRRDNDHAIVTCTADSSRSWDRTCVGTKWFGEIPAKTCPPPGNIGPSTDMFSFTIVIATLCVCLLVIFLSVILIYWYRRRHRSFEPAPNVAENTLTEQYHQNHRDNHYQHDHRHHHHDYHGHLGNRSPPGHAEFIIMNGPPSPQRQLDRVFVIENFYGTANTYYRHHDHHHQDHDNDHHSVEHDSHLVMLPTIEEGDGIVEVTQQ